MRAGRLARKPKGRNLPSRFYMALTGRLPSMMRSVKTAKKLSLEQSRQTPTKEQYIDFVLSKPLKRYRKETLADAVNAIRREAPHAKITLLPQPKKLAWFQDVRISNITVREALELQGLLGVQGLFPKDSLNVESGLTALSSGFVLGL
jgi:hypothetical protein